MKLMQKWLSVITLLCCILAIGCGGSSDNTASNSSDNSLPADEGVFVDNFNGNIVDSAKWHIPTWTSPTDGTFVGRTQFRCSQNSSLPVVVAGSAIIKLDTFNPTGPSFYGTDLISNQIFARE